MHLKVHSMVLLEDARHNFNFLKVGEACFVTYSMVGPGIDSCTAGNISLYIYSVSMGMKDSVNSDKPIHSIVCVRLVASLLSFCFIDLSIEVNGVLRFPYYYCIGIHISFYVSMLVSCS